MFQFTGSPVSVRPDLRYAYINTWAHFARPGPTLTGRQRLELLAAARAGECTTDGEGSWWGPGLGTLAGTLYATPGAVHGTTVSDSVNEAGDATTVEVIALISMLASIDGTHRALSAGLEPLPDPQPGEPTGMIAEGLKRRRTHVPVPPGAIPVTLNLLPEEGAAFQALFGPQYMTDMEMRLDDFRRQSGLDRAQIELISSRTSIHNECFY